METIDWIILGTGIVLLTASFFMSGFGDGIPYEMQIAFSSGVLSG